MLIHITKCVFLLGGQNLISVVQVHLVEKFNSHKLNPLLPFS